MKRRAGVAALIVVVGVLLFVVDQAVRTLQTLTVVERERDKVLGGVTYVIVNADKEVKS